MKIFKNFEKNCQYIKNANNQNKDLVAREFLCANKKVCVFYILEQVDDEKIEKCIIARMMNYAGKKIDINTLQKEVVSIGNMELVDDMDMALSELMKGNALVILEGSRQILKCSVSKPASRSVIEPPTSAVIFGPREGFVESTKTNVSLLRKRLPTSALVLEEMNVGKYTKTKITLGYLKDIADKKVVEKIKNRLQKISIDGIIDSQYLISFLEERKGSIFKQVGKTEKPDIAVAKMLEGRVVIFVDGSPVALTLPFVVFEDLQNSDDYYQRSFKVGLTRMLRLVGVLFSILLPGIYVAIQLFHYRVIPIRFLITIINSTQGIPFTPLLEMLFIVALFEILFEASLRMPKYLGIAISIVGALVLGDTAVKAGLISSPAVMIIALTGISFYTVPEETSQMSVLRILFTVIGGCFGMLGIIVAGLMLINYLVEFNAYGSPYLAPYAPYIKSDLKDGIFKKQTIALGSLPQSIPNQKRVRNKSQKVRN